MAVAKILQCLRTSGRNGLNERDFTACILLYRIQLYCNVTKPGKNGEIKKFPTNELRLLGPVFTNDERYANR